MYRIPPPRTNRAGGLLPAVVPRGLPLPHPPLQGIRPDRLHLHGRRRLRREVQGSLPPAQVWIHKTSHRNIEHVIDNAGL